MLRKIIITFTILISSFFTSSLLAQTQVRLQTSMGEIIIALDTQRAPITSKNFLDYVNSGFYNGLIFHRVIPGFIVQGGGFNDAMTQLPTRPAIKNEANNGISNERGTIAMARTRVVDSATSQFFINLADNHFLDYYSVSRYGYAVFGKVIKGLEVADKIASVATGRSGQHQNVPLRPIYIVKAEVIKP